MSASRALTSSTCGCKTCLRLKARSCRVSAAARSPALLISRTSWKFLSVSRIVPHQHLAAAVDDGEQVVEVVSDAAGESADRLHFRRLTKMLLLLLKDGFGPLQPLLDQGFLLMRAEIVETQLDGATGEAFEDVRVELMIVVGTGDLDLEEPRELADLGRQTFEEASELGTIHAAVIAGHRGDFDQLLRRHRPVGELREPAREPEEQRSIPLILVGAGRRRFVMLTDRLGHVARQTPVVQHRSPDLGMIDADPLDLELAQPRTVAAGELFAHRRVFGGEGRMQEQAAEIAEEPGDHVGLRVGPPQPDRQLSNDDRQGDRPFPETRDPAVRSRRAAHARQRQAKDERAHALEAEHLQSALDRRHLLGRRVQRRVDDAEDAAAETGVAEEDLGELAKIAGRLVDEVEDLQRDRGGATAAVGSARSATGFVRVPC